MTANCVLRARFTCAVGKIELLWETSPFGPADAVPFHRHIHRGEPLNIHTTYKLPWTNLDFLAGISLLTVWEYPYMCLPCIQLVWVQKIAFEYIQWLYMARYPTEVPRDRFRTCFDSLSLDLIPICWLLDGEYIGGNGWEQKVEIIVYQRKVR